METSDNHILFTWKNNENFNSSYMGKKTSQHKTEYNFFKKNVFSGNCRFRAGKKAQNTLRI